MSCHPDESLVSWRKRTGSSLHSCNMSHISQQFTEKNDLHTYTSRQCTSTILVHIEYYDTMIRSSITESDLHKTRYVRRARLGQAKKDEICSIADRARF